MKRRTFNALLGGTAAASTAWPSLLVAQQGARPLVVYFHGGAAAGRDGQQATFVKGLREAGYADGDNVAIEFLWGDGRYDRLPQMAADLVRRELAVIVAATLPSAVAARQATKTVPIVFLIGDDPLKHGLVASISHPGGNSTGISMLTSGLVAKRLGLLRELVPKAALIALLSNPDNPNHASELAQIDEASSAVGQTTRDYQAGNPTQIVAAFASIAQDGAGGLVVGADPLFTNRREQIVGLASHYKIPGIYEWREFVDQGGLLSYGANLGEMNRQAGLYAGRILKGAKPADMPVLQPTKFELVINHKTARALGLVVPPVLLAQADEVVE